VTVPGRFPSTSAHDSPQICATSAALAFVSLIVGIYLGSRSTGKIKRRRALTSLQQRATLERIFQTHYWSEGYRTQDASEDYRSDILRQGQPDQLR